MTEKMDTNTSNNMEHDVILLVGNMEIFANRIQLSEISDYFRGMFSRKFFHYHFHSFSIVFFFKILDDLIEKNSLYINLSMVDPVSLKSCLQFFQIGHIKIDLINFSRILFTADYLQMPLILNKCAEFISKKINRYNWFHIMKIINKYPYKLQSIVQDFFRNNFEQLSYDRNFLLLSFEELTNIVSDDFLYVNDEMCIYNAIKRWMNNQSNPLQYSNLLNNVRIPFIKKNALFQYIIFPFCENG